MKGLIRLSIENRLNRVLELEVQVHQLMFDLNDVNLVKTLMKSIVDRCDVNPLNNDEIFNSISSKIVIKKNFNYYQLEELSSKLRFINQMSDLKEVIRFPPEIFEVGLRLVVRDIRRIQRYVDSFLFNYQMILDTVRYVNLRISEDVIPTAENDKLFSLPPVNQSIAKIPAAENDKTLSEEIIVPQEKTRIDQILEYLIASPPLFSYLVHLIFNYFRFFRLSSFEKTTDNKFEIKLMNLFPHDFTINKMYLQGLIESLGKTSLENVNLFIKSLSQFLIGNHEEFNQIEIQCSIFVLFFYSLRHLLDTKKNWVYSHTDLLFSNCEIQCRLLNKYVPLITGMPIVFKRSKEKVLTPEETRLEEISNKYLYMKELDQNQFAEFVYSELKEESDIPPKMQISLGFKNLVNIEKMIDKKEATETEMIDLPKTSNSAVSILNYQKRKNPKILTETFDLFMRFLENPIVLVTEKNHSIPANIINLFEKMKHFLNDTNLKKENVSTLQYYHKLLPILPDDLHFDMIIFLIFQLIIPLIYMEVRI